MIEGYAFCGAVFGENCHDVRLFFGREFVFTMMVAVIRSAASAEVIADTGRPSTHPDRWLARQAGLQASADRPDSAYICHVTGMLR